MSYKAESMKIFDLLYNIEDYYLPAIQREFVWSTSKIEALFDSLMRGYPIGTLLIWDVEKKTIADFPFYKLFQHYSMREPHKYFEADNIIGECKGILDGQQRITSLYIGLQGSYVDKQPRMHRNNPAAYQKKHLYINLLHKPPDGTDQRYQIKFLTEKQAKTTNDAFWYRVGSILELKTRDKLRNFRRSTVHRENEIFEDTLYTLWEVIHGNNNIIYFCEEEQDLDEVLEIFHRLNTGGTHLSNSDILLSLMTASWGKNAREKVYELVNQLNDECDAKFRFSKDFVLKTLLVASDKDVRFKTKNVRKRENLESIWDDVRDSLKLAVRLVAGFGFDGNTLSAHNAIIPVVYYIYKRNLDDGFLTHKQYEHEREVIRNWLLKILLGNVFKGQTDGILTLIRKAIREHIESAAAKDGFPAAAINNELRRRGISIFTKESIERLIDENQYGSAHAFVILSFICQDLKFQYNFHVDHMHPRSKFTRKSLIEAGVPKDNIEFCLTHFNRLPNLQLLLGSENVSKKDIDLKVWLDAEQNPDLYRKTSYIPNVDLSLRNFREFYEERKKLMIDALRKKIGDIDTEPGDDAIMDLQIM